MRYTVLLVPDDDGLIGASVPAMPGCVSLGHTRAEALANVQVAMQGWLDMEASQGRGPLIETPTVIADAVSEALQIIHKMREAGEVSPEHGYELELTTVELQQPALA